MEKKGLSAGYMNTKGIDGIRGIGAIAIAFFSHYFYMVPERNFPFYNGLTYWCWNYARFFVEMFFLISGFVMAMNYRERIKSGTVKFWSYMGKRLIRFYPLMLVTLVLTAVVQAWHLQLTGRFFAEEIVMENTWQAFLLHVFCLQGTGFAPVSFNSPAWYLSTLLIMYGLFYLVTYIFSRIHMEDLGYALMLALGVVFAVTGYATVLLNCRGLMGFFAGCLLYRLCELFEKITSQVVRNIVLVCVGMMWVVVIAMGALRGHIIFGLERNLIIIYALVIWPPVLFLTVNSRLIGRVMQCRVFTWFGKISLSMYMIHFSVISLLHCLLKVANIPLEFESKKVFLVYIVMLMISTIICYYLVESKLTGWIRNKLVRTK